MFRPEHRPAVKNHALGAITELSRLIQQAQELQQLLQYPEGNAAHLHVQTGHDLQAVAGRVTDRLAALETLRSLGGEQ